MTRVINWRALAAFATSGAFWVGFGFIVAALLSVPA